jgi:dTDP-4-dehydrorhamnose reductase
MPPRAGNVSMCSDKLSAALDGNPFRPWPLGDDLFPTDRHWHFTRPEDEPGSVQCIAERLYRARASAATQARTRSWTG